MCCCLYEGRSQGLLSFFQNVAVMDDLPQNTVQAIVEDDAGFLWIGSESGLFRYDGRKFEKYTTMHNRKLLLKDNSVNALAKDPDKNIWVATTEGVSVFHPYRSFSKNEPLARLAVTVNQATGAIAARCFHFASNNIVYIGHVFGISVVNAGTKEIRFFPELWVNGQRQRADIVKIAEDQGQLLLLSEKQGLLKGDFKKGFTPVGRVLPNGAAVTYSGFITLSPDNYLLATSAGLEHVYKVRGRNINSWQQRSIPETAGKTMTALHMDVLHGRILAGTDANGFYVLDTACKVLEQIKKGSTHNTLTDNYVVSILADKSGEGYWIGTNHGLCRFFYKENAFTTVAFYDKNGSPNKVYPIYTENNKQLIVGTLAGLFSVDISKLPVPAPRLIKNTGNIQFYCIAKSSPSYYLLGTRKGIYEGRGGFENIRRSSITNRELAFADSSKIYCVLPLNDYEVLFAYRNDTACGIIRWNRQDRQAMVCRPDETNPLASKNKISNIVLTDAGNVIVCNNEGVVYYYPATNSFKNIALPGPHGVNYAQVSDAILDKDRMWITTYGGGINLLDLKTNTFRYITEKSGLANNDLYAIHKTAANRYWVSSNKGIGYLNTDNGQFINYTKSNGLLDNEYDRRSSFKCRDTLYFGGLSGLVCFNYKLLQQPSPAPPVFISRILSYENGSESEIPLPGDEWLSFPQGRFHLRVQLSFPYYVFPENSRFFYRVLPGDTTWLYTGNNNNSILLSGLPAGKHTIETRAISSTGAWSSNTASLRLYIKPHWFQTTWFRILSALMLIAVFIGIYKIRIHHVKKEYAIKKQISRDLHDDLGGTLSSIRLFSQMAAMDNTPGQSLEKIKEAANEAIVGLKDLIWTLDDDKNTLYDLTERLDQFCGPLFELKDIDFSVQPAPNLSLSQVHLKKKEKKELFLILKEAAVNCLKYASCKNAVLKIGGTPQAPAFLFCDDGIGLLSGAASMGNGLNNMQNRAALIDYCVDVLSSGGNGTCVRIEKKK
jgi:ligand-binding sensor domain-containing protein